MKKEKFIFGGFILLLGMTLSFMSCSIDNDDGYSDSYHDIVNIVNSGDSCYFIGSDGEKYIPVPKYTNMNNIKTAAIVFRVLSDESTSQSEQFHIKLYQDPVKLDAAVDSAQTFAKLDSVKNDSILGLKPIRLINNQYLIMAINYNINSKPHYFTLCYTEDKGFVKSGSKSISDTLKLVLRHNANNDEASPYTSYYYYNNYNRISCYYKGFYIGGILNAAYKKSGKSDIYIDIEAKIYENDNRTCKIVHTGLYPFYCD